MTKIVAFAGRKQSGKNTAVNYVVGSHMLSIGLIRTHFEINKRGELYIYDLGGDKEFEGIFDINNPHPKFLDWADEHLFPSIKMYNFADLLKRAVCMAVLGLTRKQCYGTDDEKNELTHLKWENMPGVMPEQFMQHCIDWQSYESHWNEHKTGQMTAREVMQYVGSDIFRKMYSDVWIDSTIRHIESEGSLLAIIGDCRFPNEVKGIQKVGGKVVRLTRAPFANTDKHMSEIALDNYPMEKYDAIIDNANSTIPQQCEQVYNTLCPWGFIPQLVEVNNKK